MKLWVLTSEINEYDPHGCYFKAVWAAKPTHQQLNKAGVPYPIMNHVEKGGGRQGSEFEWYFLTEIEEGSTALADD